MRRPFLNIWIVASAVGVAAFTLLDVKHVTGASMEPALRESETVIVSRWHYGPRLPFARSYCLRWRPVRRGDIVLVRHPGSGEEIIKRCAAPAGTAYRLAEDTLRIGEEAYRISPGARSDLEQHRRVPEEKVFLIGDNAPVSRDSRDYGFVDAASVEGKVVYPSRDWSR